MAKAKFTYDYEKLAKALKKARIARGMTQAVLADVTGLSIPSISRLENDRQRPTTGDLAMLCWLLDVDPFQFLKVSEGVKKTAVMFDMLQLQKTAGAA